MFTERRRWITLRLCPLITLAGCVTALPQSTLRSPRWAVEQEREDIGQTVDAPPVRDLEPHHSQTLPGGLSCLIQLQELGIAHRHLGPLPGVDTPVRVSGPVGGITYRSLGRHGLVADCRLVLALHRAAPYLHNLGVIELAFSSAYSYRMMSSGRPSRHALGLAIDVHQVRACARSGGAPLGCTAERGGQDVGPLRVDRDFELGLAPEQACRGGAPVLNRMACLLKQWGLFDRVLTPDFDRAHYNHLHLSILALRRR